MIPLRHEDQLVRNGRTSVWVPAGGRHKPEYAIHGKLGARPPATSGRFRSLGFQGAADGVQGGGRLALEHPTAEWGGKPLAESGLSAPGSSAAGRSTTRRMARF